MILNLFVAVIMAISFFSLIVGLYTAYKAYKIGNSDVLSAENKYDHEKIFYLVSTVGWITLFSRIAAVPLFWVTVVSLIPSVPGAMCEYGVFQAGAPYSWIDFFLKFGTIFAFGGWLFIDLVNRRLKGSPLMGSLSRGFVMLTPLLFLDAFLDILFFGSLQPLVVPCCMVVYNPETVGGIFSSCPFCLVTYQMPLLLGAIPAFVIAIALITWVLFLRRSDIKEKKVAGNMPIVKKALIISIVLAAIGVVLLTIQIMIGPLSTF